MSGVGRGRGRGRGGKPKNNTVLTAPESAELDVDFNPAVQVTQQATAAQASSQVEEKPARQRRQQQPVGKTPEELRRTMDIIKSRVGVIIDILEGDDSGDAAMKRNVVTAVKHLKLIDSLLE